MQDPAERVHLVCPHCGTVNRVPAQRLRDRPICGDCRKRLFSGQPIELSDHRFSDFLASSDLPVLVDFWAPWCGPCQSMAPAFAQAAARMEPQVIFAKVNTETAPVAAQRLAIRSIPTLVLFRKNREVDRVSGALSLDAIVRWATERCGLASD